jgi:two-component system, LytTR family, sensor kinase
MALAAGAMLLLVLIATAEMPFYLHTRELPGWMPGIFMLTSFLTVAVWLMLEVRSRRYLQPPLDRPWRWFFYHLKRLPLLIVAFTFITFNLRHAMLYMHNVQQVLSWRGLLYAMPFEAVKISLLYSCWLGLVFGVLSYVRMRQQAEHLLNMQKTLAEAQLSQLKAQLRPHFLFNTLNTISSVMQVDVPRADRLLTQLGDLLRANLDSSDRNLVPLSEELTLLRQYADIMQARFVGRVRVEWEVDEQALPISVPTMLLQPLLENAFIHGVEKASGNQWLRVRVAREQSALRIAIFNTGAPPREPRAEGVGLRNCRDRLQLIYGAQASLHLGHDDQGITATVKLPWQGAP